MRYYADVVELGIHSSLKNLRSKEIKGSNPFIGTIVAVSLNLAEATVLETEKCGFESLYGYH